MKTLADFINTMAQAIGVDTSTPEFKAILAGGNIDLPSPELWQRNILTRESAKRDTEVRNAIKADTLDGFEAQLASTFEGIDLSTEKGSIAKVKKLMAAKEEALRKELAKAPAKQDDEKVAELRAQLAEHVQKVAAKEAEYQQKLAEMKASYEGQLFERDFLALVAEKPLTESAKGLKTAIPGEFQRELTAKGWKLAQTQTGFQIVDTEGKPAYDPTTHKPADFATQLDTFLNTRQLVKQNNGNGGATPPNGGIPAPASGGVGKLSPSQNALLDMLPGQ